MTIHPYCPTNGNLDPRNWPIHEYPWNDGTKDGHRTLKTARCKQPSRKCYAADSRTVSEGNWKGTHTINYLTFAPRHGGSPLRVYDAAVGYMTTGNANILYVDGHVGTINAQILTYISRNTYATNRWLYGFLTAWEEPKF